MPQLTTVKVSRQTHDRLATAAKTRGISMRALLDELSRDAADAALMEQVAQQMRHMEEADPTAWAEYMREGQAWEEGTIEPLDA